MRGLSDGHATLRRVHESVSAALDLATTVRLLQAVAVLHDVARYARMFGQLRDGAGPPSADGTPLTAERGASVEAPRSVVKHYWTVTTVSSIGVVRRALEVRVAYTWPSPFCLPRTV